MDCAEKNSPRGKPWGLFCDLYSGEKIFWSSCWVDQLAEEGCGTGCGFFGGEVAAEGLMEGDVAGVADGVEAFEDGLKLDAARGVQGMEGGHNGSACPGFHWFLSGRVRGMILQVDVEEVGLKRSNGFRAVVFAAQGQVGGFVDEAKVRAVDFAQGVQGSGYGFKEAEGVALVREPDAAFGGFFGRSLGEGDVCLGFHADADEGTAQGLCEVQIRGDVAQAAGAFGFVFGYGEVSGDHGDFQVHLIQNSTDFNGIFFWTVDAYDRGAHAQGTVARTGGDAGKVFQANTGFAFVAETFGDTGGERKVHEWILAGKAKSRSGISNPHRGLLGNVLSTSQDTY